MQYTNDPRRKNVLFFEAPLKTFKKTSYTGKIPQGAFTMEGGAKAFVDNYHGFPGEKGIIEGEDDGDFFVRFCSWREKEGFLIHPIMEQMQGKRIRVTVEILSDET